MSQHSKTQIIEYLEASPFHMEALQFVDDLNLEDWAVGAGFVRNLVWDNLHGYSKPTPLNDIDVLYFDKKNIAPEHDKKFQDQLALSKPNFNWSVRNQARMHFRNNDKPYTSTINAMSFWLETPTCIGARLTKSGILEIIAPHGVDDLLNLSIKPTHSGKRKMHQYYERINSKRWLETWPNLRMVHP